MCQSVSVAGQSNAGGPSNASESGTSIHPFEHEYAVEPELRRADFPKVSFWERRDYNTWKSSQKGVSGITLGKRGNAQASQGMNVNMQYVENANGIPVDGFRAASIRSTAYSIFFELKERGCAPTVFSKIVQHAKVHYIVEMERNHPELRLCANHWKSLFVATQNYPSWYGHHGMDVKTEAGDSDDAAQGAIDRTGKRRAATLSASVLPKRARTRTDDISKVRLHSVPVTQLTG